MPDIGEDDPPKPIGGCRHSYLTPAGWRTLYRRIKDRVLDKQHIFIFRCAGCDKIKLRRLTSTVGVGGIPVISIKVSYPEEKPEEKKEIL